MQQSYSPEFQEILTQVESALIQAGKNARKLAEQTGTELVVMDCKSKNESYARIFSKETLGKTVHPS